MIRSIPRIVLLAAAAASGAALFACGAGAETEGAVPAPPGGLCSTPPVVGEQIVAFGQPAVDGSPSRGVVIRTAPGAQAVAPCDGLIVYAGQFRTYGNMVIISVEGGYHIILAGLALIDAEVGQTVLAGAPIGTLPRPSVDSAAPSLTIEVRKDAQPFDPAVLLRKS